jgi:murein DD-endopeptidase MepM/ murein hydrolase activator NlpD
MALVHQSTIIVLAFVSPVVLAAQQPRVSVAPAKPEPGSIVRLTLEGSTQGADAVRAMRGVMAGEPLHFLAAGAGVWHALGAVPVDATDSVVARVIVERTSGAVDTIRARVLLPAPPPPAVAKSARSRLTVDSRFTQPLDSATEARVARENERARQVGQRAHDSPPLWTLPFIRPRTSAVTSTFGSGRVFNGRVTSRHLGVDFKGAVGAPVHAANRGVVALVDEFFLAGNVVYIDHGAGVVSGYFQLSETLVAAGDTVQRGQEIGRVGATGRVTGPHLHWSARYGALAVDPLDLVALERGWYSGALAPRSPD